MQVGETRGVRVKGRLREIMLDCSKTVAQGNSTNSFSSKHWGPRSAESDERLLLLTRHMMMMMTYFMKLA